MPSIYRNGIKYSGAGGTYTAGEGIDITNNEISVDTDDIQEKLVSGTNIKTVNNNSLLGSGNISISSGSKNVWYGTSDTAATTQAKVATTSSGDFILTTGNMVRIKFTNANTYNGTATLNIDGKGAVNITRVGTTTTTRYFWTAGEVVDFVYDGTNFVMSNKGVATTTYYGETKLSDSTASTSTSLAATANAVKTAYDLAATKSEITTTTASLTSTGWSSNSKTVSVTGVTASNSVLVTPAPASMDDYANCGIKCTAQAAGTLTFSCTTVPSSTITVNVMIID